MRTLSEVAKLCPSAGLVWLALCRLVQERDSASLRLSRATLLELSGIQNPKTISKALGALETAGWLSRRTLFHSKAGGVRAHVQVTLCLGAKNDFNLPRCVRRVKDDVEPEVEQPVERRQSDPVRPQALDVPIAGLDADDRRALVDLLRRLIGRMEQQYQSICQDPKFSPADKPVHLNALLDWDREARAKLHELGER